MPQSQVLCYQKLSAWQIVSKICHRVLMPNTTIVVITENMRKILDSEKSGTGQEKGS